MKTKKTLDELRRQRDRLIDIVEHDKTCGRWVRYKGFVKNEKGKRYIIMICSTYNAMRKQIIDDYVDEHPDFKERFTDVNIFGNEFFDYATARMFVGRPVPPNDGTPLLSYQ